MNKVFTAISGFLTLLALPLPCLAQPALIDTNFIPALNAGAQVYAVVPLTNGQILVGGSFTTVGSPGFINIARLNQNGTVDTNFNPGAAADIGYVTAIAVQTNGKVVIGGSFASSLGITPSNLARLNTNGTPDSGFDITLWMDDAVNTVAIQPDNKILFGGAFQIVDGYARRSAARLESNGTLDTGFDACVASSSGAGATVLVLLSGGKILMSGGNFAFTTGTYRIGVARLNPNGDIDTSYAPLNGLNSGGVAYAMACRSDERAFIGGNFSTYDGIARSGIAQLTTTGYVDSAFSPGTGITSGATNFAIALQTSGKIIIGGSFTSYNGQTKNRIARINANGSLDASFDAGSGPNDSIGALAVQSDGKILVSGRFNSFNGTARNGIVRLQGDPISRLDAPQRLANGQTRIVFHGREQVHYSIDASTNLTNWISITDFTVNTNTLAITDPEIKSVRFYRAVSLP